MVQRILVFLLILNATAWAQTSENDTADQHKFFHADREAKEAVAKILKYTGLEPNFFIVESSVPTVIAYVRGGQRYIGYNPDFIRKVRNAAKTDWAAVSVLAHDIGHHLSGHTLKPKGINPGDELAADKFSGFILFQMGATLDEAKSALKSVGHEIDTIEHPGTDIRLQAVSNGWIQAKLLSENKLPTSDFLTDDDKTKLVLKCKFKGDPNVYFVDENDQIVWYDNYGKSIVIGKKEEAESRNYSWMYKYLDFNYGVDFSGNIWDMTSPENVFIVGQVYKLTDEEKNN